MSDILKIIDEALSSFIIKIKKNNPYALIAKNRFDVISRLLKEGATFDNLFDHLAENGVLSKDGNPGSLQKAFRREALKRNKNYEAKSYDAKIT